MPVFVDNMKAKYGRLIMCHMLADSDEELHAMADMIGVARKWHQSPPKHDSHYDIALSKRSMAVKHGAIEITWKQASAMTMRRRIEGTLGNHAEAIEWVYEHFNNRKVATHEV